MKETEQESAALKAAFKDHFAAHGLDSPLPADLQAEADAFPLEYSEACDEFCDEKPFTIPEISIGMDESEYINAVDLIGTAATLAGDGEGGELGRNAEYERGMAELIARFMNWGGDRVPEVIAAIHGTAKDANRTS